MSVAHVQAARDELRQESFGHSRPARPCAPVSTPPLAWLPPAVRARLEALPLRSIVAGVALLEADPLIPPALELAGELGATLHLVHAFDLPSSPFSFPLAAGSPDTVPAEQYTQAQEERLRRTIPAASRLDRVVCHAVEGVASECLEELVRENRADLLILGTNRPPESSGRPVGSTAYRLIRVLRVPVLVLTAPEGGAAGSLRPATLFFAPAQPMTSPAPGRVLVPAAALTGSSRAGAAVDLRGTVVRALPCPPEPLVPHDRHARTDHVTPRRA